MTSPHRLSRRAVLRGLGVTMALPWLESLSVWGDEPARGISSTPPVRMAVLFAGNGFHNKEWYGKGEGKTFSDFDYAGPMTEAVLLGNVALRTGKRIAWDADNLRVTNAPEAAQFIRRDYRGGF